VGEPVSVATLRANPPPPRQWLWHGLISPGAVTLLTAVWKSGKTTLLAALLNQFGQEASLLAGRAVRRAKALILSEEAYDVWYDRVGRFGIPNNIMFWCRPLPGKPTPEQWEPLIERTLRICREHKVDLVVVDPLASFLPVNDENDNARLMRVLGALQRLTDAGIAVLLLHHPRKGRAVPGQMARGGGALCGFADILVEMTRPAGSADDRRRVLHVYSRFTESPPSLCIRLNAAGTGFEALGDADTAEQGERWLVLGRLFRDAPRPLTAREVRECWPEDEPAPAEEALLQALRRAHAAGLLHRRGKGGKGDPFRYSLPGRFPEVNLNDIDPLTGLTMF
jgi:hypothetical protein